MGEICALHNMNNYMHFFGIVFLYIIFIIVVIYFIYTLYCKHKNIVEKYDTSSTPDNPRSYHDDKYDPTFQNLINNNADYLPNYDILNNNNISDIMRNNFRNCKIKFKETCTPEDGSNCEYTFKGGWKENSTIGEKYITANSSNIPIDNYNNSYLNYGCHKKFNPNGNNFEYNGFNTNYTEHVLKILPFDTSANDTNNNGASINALSDEGISNYISMYFDTRGENNLSKILNNICSYDEQIPNALPENLYKLNLTKDGDNYKISSITKVRIDPNTGIINIHENGGVINNNILTESINAIKLIADGDLIKVQKKAKISEINNIILYKFNFNTLCHNNKITGVVKSQPVKLYANNLYSYENNQTQTWFPVADNKYLSLNGNRINLNDIFSDENDKAYFKNNLNAMIDNVDYHLTNKINTIIDNYNTNPIKINARKSIEAKMDNLKIKIKELEELRDNYLKNINNLKYIDKYDSNYTQYQQNINKYANEIQDIKNSNVPIVEGFNLGEISTNANNYLISNCEFGDNKEDPRNKIYTVFEENNRNIEPEVSPNNVQKQISSDQIPNVRYQYITLTYESAHPNYYSSVVNNQRVHTINFPENVIADILVVGGGGGGGRRHGGGGGAGTLIYHKGITLNGTYTVKVGKGGDGITGEPLDGGPTGRNATNGNNSEFVKQDGTQRYLAVGGGRGTSSGYYDQLAYTNGGQGMLTDSSLTLSSGNYFNGNIVQVNNNQYVNKGLIYPEGCRGNIGGRQINNYKGAGGGGAGSRGMNHGDENTPEDGYGGDGIAIDITGNYVIYAGGGNGSDYNGNVSQVYDPNKPTIELRGGGGYGSDTGTAENGKNGTGGGGGGQGNDYTGTSGFGGSGIVIIRYYKVADVVNDITHKYLAFTYNGTTEMQTTYDVNFPINTTCDILVVGGGGGGGRRHGGGGGAGTLIYHKGIILNGTYTVKVGKGGNGIMGGGLDGGPTGINATDGNNSEFVKQDGTQRYLAVGGGRGTSSGYNDQLAYTNGGQGMITNSSLTLSSGNYFNGNIVKVDNNQYVNEGLTYPEGCRGNIGGRQINNFKGAGGGGAGSRGMNHGDENTPEDGYGGDGIAIDITGKYVIYAGGGNGCDYNGNVPRVYDPNKPTIELRGGGGYGSDTGTAENGENGTGGGGGGQGNDFGGTSGFGGSGIVIIRYEIPRSRTIKDVIACDDKNNYVYQSKSAEFINIGNKFSCVPSSTSSTPSNFTYNLNDREIKAHRIKGEVITGSYQCPPNTKLKISLNILLNNGDLSMDRISYVYEIKLNNNNIGELIENNKCTSSGPSYTFRNTTSDFKILNLYANIVINNNHSSKINYSYIFNVSVDNNTTSSFTNNKIVEPFLTKEPNEWESKTYIQNGYDIVLKEDIDDFLKGLAITPINAATKYIKDYNDQLKNDDQFLIIDRDCNKFNIKPNECNYIEKINLNKRDFNMAFSTNNINSLFSSSEIPSPQFIPNVPITNVFNISNIKNYITEEQQSEPSMRVPKFTPGGYSLYFQINSN